MIVPPHRSVDGLRIRSYVNDCTKWIYLGHPAHIQMIPKFFDPPFRPIEETLFMDGPLLIWYMMFLLLHRPLKQGCSCTHRIFICFHLTWYFLSTYIFKLCTILHLFQISLFYQNKKKPKKNTPHCKYMHFVTMTPKQKILEQKIIFWIARHILRFS